MKRALALLEQTKHTMPHLPRPSTIDSDSDTSGSSVKAPPSRGIKRNPSAMAPGKRVTIDAGDPKTNARNT